MEEFLNKLYSYEYFGTYLMVSIVVLLLLFIIILFFGKKDQRKREIEATKKLQQINNENAFKEESLESSVEVNAAPETVSLTDQNLDDTIIVPNINEVPVESNIRTEQYPEMLESNLSDVNPAMDDNYVDDGIYRAAEVTNPQVEESVQEQVQDVEQNPFVSRVAEPTPTVMEESTPIFDQPFVASTRGEVKDEVEPLQPLLDRAEEKPLSFDDIYFNEPTSKVDVEPNVRNQDLSYNERVQETFNYEQSREEVGVNEPVIESNNFGYTNDVLGSRESETQVPSFNFDEIIQGVEETRKEQTVTKTPEVFSSVYAPNEQPVMEEPKEVNISSDEELDFELPSLKKADYEEEKPKDLGMPMLNDYKLDELTGESYTINR